MNKGSVSRITMARVTLNGPLSPTRREDVCLRRAGKTLNEDQRGRGTGEVERVKGFIWYRMHRRYSLEGGLCCHSLLRVTVVAEVAARYPADSDGSLQETEIHTWHQHVSRATQPQADSSRFTPDKRARLTARFFPAQNQDKCANRCSDALPPPALLEVKSTRWKIKTDETESPEMGEKQEQKKKTRLSSISRFHRALLLPSYDCMGV